MNRFKYVCRNPPSMGLALRADIRGDRHGCLETRARQNVRTQNVRFAQWSELRDRQNHGQNERRDVVTRDS